MGSLTQTKIEQLRHLAEEYVYEESNVGRCLGAGASAAVFEVERAGRLVALKVYDPDFFREEGAAAERRRLELQRRLIDHDCPYLVQVLDVAFDEQTCFVEMPLIQGPDLSAVLRELPRSLIHPLIRQLAAAARYLEEKELVHRDIKPQNIKISPDYSRLTLLDLGVIRELEHDNGSDATNHGKRKPFIATAQYSSPEYLFWLHPPSKDFWRGLSLYQVGGVLHDMIMKRPIFADEVAMENRYALAMAVLQSVPDTHADDVAPWLCSLAARCLTKDLRRRLSMVSWSDFEEMRDGTARVVARFKQVSRAGIQPLEQAAQRDARLLKRRNLMERLLDQLDATIREKLEARQLQRVIDGNDHTLSIKISRTGCTLDFTLHFSWDESGPIETAGVASSALLRPDSVAVSHKSASRDLVTLSELTMQSAIDCASTELIARLGCALDLMEISGEPTEPVSLD